MSKTKLILLAGIPVGLIAEFYTFYGEVGNYSNNSLIAGYISWLLNYPLKANDWPWSFIIAMFWVIVAIYTPTVYRFICSLVLTGSAKVKKQIIYSELNRLNNLRQNNIFTEDEYLSRVNKLKEKLYLLD